MTDWYTSQPSVPPAPVTTSGVPPEYQHVHRGLLGVTGATGFGAVSPARSGASEWGSTSYGGVGDRPLTFVTEAPLTSTFYDSRNIGRGSKQVRVGLVCAV